MNRVLIVGGGASGILVATQLARLAKTEISVTIADPSIFLGKGVAYGTRDTAHLLNVPAGRMSIFADEPNHFCDWSGLDPNAFAPRSTYANYLMATFVREQLSNSLAQFEHLQDSVLSIDSEANGTFRATFEKSDSQSFDQVVLAIGQGEPISHERLTNLADSPRVITDSWRQESQISNGTLVCIGTGLTFIDHALSHIRKSPENKVIGISRTGLLPEPHLPKRALPLEVPESARKSPKSLREFIETSDDWRAAQDGVRHIFPEIWFAWAEDQKKEFVKNDLRWWNVHRHRVSPEINQEFQAAIESGKVVILQDEVTDLIERPETLEVTLRSGAKLTTDTLMNCLGYESNGRGPLVDSLILNGLATSGPLGWGIRSNFPSHQVLGGNGQVSTGIYALGPILLGERFETTAIPELRVQAKDVAEALVNS